MAAVQVRVGVDHLRLDPQAELHAETVHLVDQRVQTARENVRTDGPVTQARVIAAAAAEPTVVHAE